MSNICTAWVLEHSQHRSTELLVLLVLADHADKDGKCFPGVKRLARRCRMSTRNLNYILNALRAGGELQVDRNAGPHGTNRYRLRLSHVGDKPVNQPSALQRVSDLNPASSLKQVAPAQPIAGVKPASSLKPTSAGSEAGFPKGLNPTSDKPSLNLLEPEGVPKHLHLVLSARGTRLPADWTLPLEWRDWAVGKRSDISVDRVAENFHDYWVAQPDPNARKADWFAVWRNWVRRESLPASGAYRGGHHRSSQSNNYTVGIPK
jgi:hypothetical protein